MSRAKHRRIVTPVKDQNSSTLFHEHVVKQLDAPNVLVVDYDVVHKEKPTPFWMRDLKIPRWLLILLTTVAILAFTAFLIFATVVTLKKGNNGDPCKQNSDCREDLGLICNNYRCGCAYSHFWSNTYNICERRRMLNRTCYNDSECDILGNLKCLNVTVSGGGMQSQCQCETGMTWNGAYCGTQGLFGAPCIQDVNCDTSRYLYCDTSSGTGLCNCNTSMFWNGNAASGTCEYKRTVNQYCFPYLDSWCDDTGPVGQRLTCASYANPYGSDYGICQCGTHEYYNGSASLGNGYCVAQLLYNQPCSSTSQCDYRLNLTCSNNLCTCPSGYNYDPNMNSGGIVGSCTPAAGYLDNCSVIITCITSQNLFCNLSYYGGNSSGICLCNSSWTYWDGTTCASKLSIGGKCSNNTQCITSSGLFCSNYTQSIGQCDCDENNFWNYTCTTKQWYNTTCPSSYVCDDNRGLFCQGTGTSMFLKCDCYNSSFIWDSLYTNRSYTCIEKLAYNQTYCYGNLECQDFNYFVCNNGTCGCVYTDYYDGSRCQPKRNYTDPCNYTYQCRDFNPVDLVCVLGTTAPPVPQCLCNASAFWEVCQQACVTSKGHQQPCTLTSNCTSNECDIRQNLQCINDSSNNATGGMGWCNCTTLQWWNGTYCRSKGTPSWGANSSAICNSTYQCADYNLVSCPLGGNWPTINSTCECATTKYWNGFTCLDRVAYGQPCTSWPLYPVSTSTCLSAAGAGLNCSSSICPGGTNCTGGTCQCPTGTLWNATFLICAAVSSTG